MRRALRALAWTTALYGVGWVVYVVKSVAGVDLVAYDTPMVGGHHGSWFPGSDRVAAALKRL